MKNTPTDISAILHSLTVEQLRRLDAALSAAGSGMVDMQALVAALIATPAPVLARGNEHRTAEIDGGRAYELTLDGADLETAKAQHQAEWERVDAMVLAGMSYEEAWAQIRRDTAAGHVMKNDSLTILGT